MKTVFNIIALFGTVAILVACPTVTTNPNTELNCEQRFDRALERGVPYTDALGAYTQCLLDRGDTINSQARNR